MAVELAEASRKLTNVTDPCEYYISGTESPCFVNVTKGESGSGTCCIVPQQGGNGVFYIIWKYLFHSWPLALRTVDAIAQ